MAINPQLVHHKLHHKLHHQVVVQARCSYIMLCHEIDLTPSIAGFTSKQAYKMGIPAIGIVAVLVANVTFSAWQSPPGKNPAPPPLQVLACSICPAVQLHLTLLLLLTSILHINLHMSLTLVTGKKDTKLASLLTRWSKIASI